MKVLVAVKRVVDYNVKVRPKADGSGVDLNNVKMSINPFCEIAVEEAVRLKEKDSTTEVVVVSIGPQKAQEQIRTSLALGADRGIFIASDTDLEPLAIAKCLKAICDQENPELGLVGKPTKVNPRLLRDFADKGIIPVIAPLGMGENGETFNINGDTAAGAIAASLKADRLLLLTDVAGVLDKQGNLMTDLDPADIARLREDGTIGGGMIPKLETCVHAVEGGCDAAVVLDGRVAHAMLLEFFTEQGAGTLIRAGEASASPET